MKKRSKIIALVTTLCLCLSMFTIGVLAATSATFNVTSTLNFEAKGVYVMVDASLKQGADVSTAQVLSGEGAPTGQTTYKAYSYPRMETGTTPDAPNGEASTSYFVDSTGTQWAIGDITYTSENVVVVYEFLVSNYSPFEVTGTVEGISEALTSYTDQLSITTYTGTTSADATATSSPTYTFSIPARTNETTPGVTCYKIAVTLNNFMIELATGAININISFEKAPEPVYEYFTYSGNRITGLSDTYLNLETKPETLVIPNTDAEGNDITTIQNGSSSSPTFQGLVSSKVIIQEGIITIGSYTFSGCSSLTSVSLSSTLTSIGDYAFYNCSSLTGELVIPEGVTSVGSSAFYNCSGLTSVDFGEDSQLTSIGTYAFYNCSGLTGDLVIPEGVTSIRSRTFSGCSGLTGDLVIPEGVTSIGTYAFYNCSSLTSVDFGEDSQLTSIGNYAFQICSGLTSVSLPSSLTSIGSWTFSGCSSLTELVIPEVVTSIAQAAFSGCTSLKYIQITGNLTSSYTFGKLSGTWVRTDSADEPTDWTNTVTEIPTTNSAGYYHQKSPLGIKLAKIIAVFKIFCLKSHEIHEIFFLNTLQRRFYMLLYPCVK